MRAQKSNCHWSLNLFPVSHVLSSTSLQDGSGPARVFCQMEGREFGQDGVWMRVSND